MSYSSNWNRGNLFHVEIPCDIELLSMSCRRGRRRIREIQESSGAKLKLDKVRGVLHVSGQYAEIADVRRQIESLGGPRRSVAPATWAELMRTRTVDDASVAAIACIQHRSACRIHIERTSPFGEVRLFGTKEAMKMADKLIEELEQLCSSEAVPTFGEQLDTETLQTLAHSYGVTLRIEDAEITVLGFQSAVHEAAQELARYVAMPSNFELKKPSLLATNAASSAMATLEGGEDTKERMSFATTTSGSLGSVNSQQSQNDDARLPKPLAPPIQHFTKTGNDEEDKVPYGCAAPWAISRLEGIQWYRTN